jgi:hypothetical protein
MSEKLQHYLTIFGFTSGILLLILTVFLNYQNFSLKNKVEGVESRKTMEKAMEFVKEKKPTPPVSAIFYAEVSTKIFEGENVLDFENILSNILEQEKNLPKTILKKGTDKNEFWIGENPFSPNIGNYKRYFIDENFTYKVPQPPKYKSKEFNDALKIVKEVSDIRTTEHNAIINFFGGIPGTETPSGIWQNLLWNVVVEDFKNLENLNIEGVDKKDYDKKYAYVQMILAKSLADAFMECWKVKYIYQTKRPSMTDKSINLAMANPPFPSYVSGHSTISAAAAVVLSKFFPQKLESFVEDAENAKNSRLWAGIHFPYDNDEGYKLGEEIGKFIVEKNN